MTLDRDRAEELLQAFDFKRLFIEELGWDRSNRTFEVEVAGERHTLRAVAQKRAFAVFEHVPNGNGVPSSGTRIALDREIRKLHFEHLVIYPDAAQHEQRWQWVRKERGRPTRSREQRWVRGRRNELLLQSLARLAFSLDEEAALTLPEVAQRVQKAFDIERVTKRFYTQFQKEHDVFLEFVKGITGMADREWYASVMLNRLMFVYFIQKRGFLDGDLDYLRSRLERVKASRGRDKFFSFYRHFLLRLFHDGLGGKARDAELTALIGRVPYVNGGLFLLHPIEERYPAIEIPDVAFERVFAFFDEYQWHLDERAGYQGNEINPDVIGYIFEKYINQKELGAYYTKDDITHYISRSTIVPWLLGRWQRERPALFAEDGPARSLLTNAPDSYIPAALAHGVEHKMPAKIVAGLDDFVRRGGWNAAAGDEGLALPTETWREVVERRARHAHVRTQLASGRLTTVTEMLEANLDIEQFALDVIRDAPAADDVHALWGALSELSVLDPTCGSGAFLFAALGVLEPLYEACLERMQVFVDEAAGKRGGATEAFRQILAEVDVHPSRDYYVLKQIVISNLYGVDLVEEATEICKLRLFLKLVAQAETLEQLEPLPDIDFNIRAGNALVGYGSRSAMETSLSADLVKQMALPKLVARAEKADAAFTAYRALQTDMDADPKRIAKEKRALQAQMVELREELDAAIAEEYGVQMTKVGAYKTWRSGHAPFHWFAEFYGIMSHGGFDVIIGNPPYIELKELKGYEVRGYETEAAGNLYALVLERSMELAHAESRLGLIVPVSSISTDRYESLQRRLTTRELFYSSYDDRPSRLFDGLQHIRLTIHILGPESGAGALHSTNYQKWHAAARLHLFDTMGYVPAEVSSLVPKTLPKLTSTLERSVLAKLGAEKGRLATFYAKRGGHTVYYSRKVGYFLQVLDFQPGVHDGTGKKRPPSEFKELRFQTKAQARAALAALNSSLFFWFVTVFSDCRHLNKREVDAFPLDLARMSADFAAELDAAAEDLMTSLKANSEVRTMRFKHDTLTIQCIIPRASKPEIDRIDRILAEHYGFTDEELDFLMNYDAKFRLGAVSQEGEEE
ncbi:hypothetical protein BH23GEM9_BH23GEM9_20250 [soil metagenome]